ncbi:hypothetical protein GY45DRAFT_328902 [Cubamyces sp. BRFM 1775]|nr:hypothetical protein GY45DRAFT_328902 [Cubamyces sp. BRFM 1775]
MHGLSTVVVLAILAFAVRANPLPDAEAHTPFPVIATLDITSTPASPGHTLPGSTTPASESTDGSLVARQSIYPATLLTCASANCANCLAWDLENRGDANCFFAGQFVSVGISQPSNVGLPFSVDISPGNCVNWIAIPAVNTCYNINGAVFEQFGVDDIIN